MTTDTEIRRRKDGSIDIAYYAAKGRAARSEQAQVLGGGFCRRLGNLFKIRLPHPKALKTAPHSH